MEKLIKFDVADGRSDRQEEAGAGAGAGGHARPKTTSCDLFMRAV